HTGGHNAVYIIKVKKHLKLFKKKIALSISHMNIREATIADLEVLFGFQQGVILTERPFDPTIKDDPITYYDIEAMIVAPDTAVYVAEVGDQIVGCGYAQVREAKPYIMPEKYGYLGFMYVRPAYRGKGINQAVINALKQWCTRRGLMELRLSVYSENIGAIQAYKKAGFAPLLIEMRMDLNQK
ncbi:MAG TPA: GNAT family N-acetyltransferase, partial [Arachidicoccus sp.]|nr:GNAT family N-acetyltransferase [Arachidicoccus sp.]